MTIERLEVRRDNIAEIKQTTLDILKPLLLVILIIIFINKLFKK